MSKNEENIPGLRKVHFEPSTLEDIDRSVYNFVRDLNLQVQTNKGAKQVPVLWATSERSFLSKNEKELRESLSNIPARHFPAKVTPNDNYSLINCCGDFQLAHKNIWNEIKGFEEELIYVLYSDTNVQKKAIKHGFELKAIYSPALFHIFHGKGGGGFLDGINRKVYDMYRAVTAQEKTENADTWGFEPIEMEYELL